MLGGILWVARTGSSWREMPEEYGPVVDVLLQVESMEEARLVATYPPSAGRRGVARTGDQETLTDAVGSLLRSSVNNMSYLG